MPMPMFKAPGVATSSPWAQEEWVVLSDNTNNMRYGKAGASSWTLLYSMASPNPSNPWLATNGTFVFTASPTSANVRQYAWNGSALTQRLEADPGAVVSNSPYDGLYIPNNSGHLCIVNAGDFGAGVQTFTFASAPTYVYGTPTSYSPIPSTGWTRPHDFRVGAIGVQGYGNTFVVETGNVSSRFDSMTVSGTTVTGHSNLTITGAFGGGKRGGHDRDTGLIVTPGTTANLCYMAQMNMTTRALSTIGNGTITGTTLIAATACKGFVVTWENTGKIRSYSRSGSTLTLVSTVDLGGSDTDADLQVSPYTNRIFARMGSSGSSVVLSISDAGVLANLFTLTSISRAGGVNQNGIVFLPAALPTV